MQQLTLAIHLLEDFLVKAVVGVLIHVPAGIRLFDLFDCLSQGLVHMVLADEVRIKALKDQVDLLETLRKLDGHLCEGGCVDGDRKVEVHDVFNTELNEKFGQV